MDTEDLTIMAYHCIYLAEDTTDVLKSEIGAECSQYKTEDEYLHGILEDVLEIEEDPIDYLDYWNMLDQINIKTFLKKLKILRRHIQKTLNTEISVRG